ncbi:cytochrome c oxidase subunit II [Variovorax sp. LG9.2]|uniref:cytochrome c oxidase subunit II n=1 Tax=Variovorax sp. LG9.2 TaxID=3048626 RepID=UPI002B235F43|nr:cytochrome c oxidase subunit II [Variovorax sp. LG9.2]MEB0059695.1 cytochrome c oxidase subunit II [Variovorax sp. LG9.2]
MTESAAPLAYFHTAGPAADPITRLGWGLGIVSIAVVVIIAVLLLLAIFRKRHRSDGASERADEHAMAPSHKNAGLSWIAVGTGVSTLVLFGCAVWTLVTLSTIAAPRTAPRVVIEVQAYQFWWRVRYLDVSGTVLLTTANEIHIPVGQPVRFRLSSGDVIHSFWVPALGGKMDAIPGQTNVTWLQGSQVGRYRGQCSEYCGLQHAHMAFFVDVDSAADFEHWVDTQRRPASLPAQQDLAGARIFMNSCAGCHAVQGTEAHGAVGPDLTHLMTRKTIAAGVLPNGPSFLKQWIASTQTVKPGSEMPVVRLSASELNAIVGYLATLR